MHPFLALGVGALPRLWLASRELGRSIVGCFAVADRFGQIEDCSLSDLGVPKLSVEDSSGKHAVPWFAGGEPVEGVVGVGVDLQPAPDAFELLASHADVRLIDDKPAFGAIGVEERPNVLAVAIQPFWANCIEEKEGTLENQP
jgi:hypothetical protein